MLWRSSLILIIAFQPVFSGLTTDCMNDDACVVEVIRACECCCGSHEGGTCPCIAKDDAPTQPSTPAPAAAPSSRISLFLAPVAIVAEPETAPIASPGHLDTQIFLPSTRTQRTRLCIWQT